MLILLDSLVRFSKQSERNGALAEGRDGHLLLLGREQSVADLADDGLDFEFGSLCKRVGSVGHLSENESENRTLKRA